MKSGKARSLLCWLGAIIFAIGGHVFVPALYAAFGNGSLLSSYAFNALLQVVSFVVPALLVLNATLRRWQRFKKALRPLNIHIVGHSALAAVSGTVVVSLLAAIWSAVLYRLTGNPAPSNPAPNPTNAGQWALTMLSIAVVPALAEELLFRGLLQGTAFARFGKAGVWLAALVFALVHFEWYALPGLLLLGLMLGFVYQRHGYWASALFHGLYNAAVTVLVAKNAMITPLIALICVACFVFAVKGLMRKEDAHEADRAGL